MPDGANGLDNVRDGKADTASSPVSNPANRPPTSLTRRSAARRTTSMSQT